MAGCAISAINVPQNGSKIKSQNKGPEIMKKDGYEERKEGLSEIGRRN